MKVPVDIRRTIKLFIIADLAFAVVLFLSCMNLFLFMKWGVVQFLIIGLWVAVSITMLLLSLKRNFYVIESKHLVVVRAYKEVYYPYNDVVYIDKEQSEKKRTVCFMLNNGATRYLPFDKEGLIYKEMCKKCKNLLSKEDFEKHFPKVKL